METRKSFLDLSVEEIEELCSKVTPEQIQETNDQIEKILERRKESKIVHRTMADIERELLISDMPFEIVRR